MPPTLRKKRSDETVEATAKSKRRKSNKSGRQIREINPVESILDCFEPPAREEKRTVYFLVKWEGYSDSESTWESAKNVLKSRDLVDAFLLARNKKLVVDIAHDESWTEDA